MTEIKATFRKIKWNINCLEIDIPEYDFLKTTDLIVAFKVEVIRSDGKIDQLFMKSQLPYLSSIEDFLSNKKGIEKTIMDMISDYFLEKEE